MGSRLKTRQALHDRFDLRRVAQLFEYGRAQDARVGDALAAAQTRADVLADSSVANDGVGLLALLGLVADCFAALWVERPWNRADVDEVLESVAEITGVPLTVLRTAVALELIRDPGFLRLPPRVAIEGQLRVVATFTAASAVSLWTHDSCEQLHCGIALGVQPSRRARELARDVLAGKQEHELGGPGRRVRAVPVLRWQRPHAALVLRAGPAEWPRCLPLAQQAAAAIGGLLERELLLDRNATRERALVAASERRLTRLAFDVHDGAVQEVAALAADVSLFRRQLPKLGIPADRLGLALGRVDDLQALLVALDSDLRAVCHSVESGTMVASPLQSAIGRELEWTASRGGLQCNLNVSGDLEAITDSQRIALFRIVQECLSNVREHSGATEVAVTVAVERGHVEATVHDNGCGFDVERRLVQAARRGRLGLVGLHERARLLGGTCVVTSELGGPTMVSVVLPRWEPEKQRTEEQDGGATAALPSAPGA